MGLVRCFSRHLPGYFVSISFLRGVSQVGSAVTEKRQIANSSTGSSCIRTHTPLPIKISVIAPTKPWSGLILRRISWGALTLRGGIETKPERNLGNPGVSFPPEKQKHTVFLPGQFHGKWNIHVGLFSWFLAHSGAPRKQSLKSPCFVSSNFSCFNFFPTKELWNYLATRLRLSQDNGPRRTPPPSLV